MTINVRVQCISHVGGRDAHGHITGIGGVNPNTTRWWLSERDAIEGIKMGKWAFYVTDGIKTANVIIVRQNGHEILKTEADSYINDNLLSLPRCPA